MNYTPDLFDEPRVAIGKTDTSLEAAKVIQPVAKTIRERVLACIKSYGKHGATPSEVATRTSEKLLNVRPRTTELRNMGLIKDSTERRKNDNDINEIVWIAT